MMPTDLKKMVHYVIARTDPSKLGYTKLNKILWYADLEYYQHHSRSLTGLAHYLRMPQGPMSKDISRAIRQLCKDGLVTERRVKVFDYERRELIWLKAPNISEFTAEQIDILNRMIDLVSPLTADEVSQLTHKDAFWKELNDNDLMAIGPGSVMAHPPTPKQLKWALENA